jgi:hypothetical protein
MQHLPDKALGQGLGDAIALGQLSLRQMERAEQHVDEW